MFTSLFIIYYLNIYEAFFINILNITFSHIDTKHEQYISTVKAPSVQNDIVCASGAHVDAKSYCYEL